MTATRIPLNVGRSATASAAGTARVTLGPGRGGPRQWEINRVVVKTSTPGTPPIPRCTLYVGTEDDQGLQDVTYDGSFDATDLAGLTIFNGSSIIAAWTGVAPGVLCTLSVSGWQVGT